MEKVEGAKDQALRTPSNGRSEPFEIRAAILILHNDFAIDDCGAALPGEEDVTASL
jgi:hypothetical protein